jgi:redox-sensing transcriptional repressor
MYRSSRKKTNSKKDKDGENMENKQIPKATAKRLPLYYRYLKYLFTSGKKKVSSADLSEAVKIDSATIRRDFSYFGALGKRGYGYDVEDLMNFFSRQLNQEQLTNVALVGVGHIGRALLNYNFQGQNSIRISAGFDVKEDLVNSILEGVPIYHIDELEEQVKAQQFEVAIIAVPGDYSQDITDRLVEAGIKGIMNFTPMRLSVPDSVRILNIDLSNELQSLIYFVQYSDSILDDDKV